MLEVKMKQKFKLYFIILKYLDTWLQNLEMSLYEIVESKMTQVLKLITQQLILIFNNLLTVKKINCAFILTSLRDV